MRSVCALHKHKTFALSQHLLQPYPNRNLDVARRICNYRLTRARRMVECAFGIMCNKWRIFQCAIEVRPDFCNGIVKTCCILHNFVSAFSFRIHYKNVSSRVLRLSAIEVMLQERIWGEVLRGREFLFTGEPGRGLVCRGHMCKRRLWRRAPLSIGAPLGRMGGSPFTGSSER